jgi:hypothetical protein
MNIISLYFFNFQNDTDKKTNERFESTFEDEFSLWDMSFWENDFQLRMLTSPHLNNI